MEGRALEGIDLESIWSSNPHEREQRMRRGRDFDDVVLALPLGVLAGRGGKAPCAALLENHPRLRRAIERINLVPTVAAQLWTDRRLDAFGERVAMPSWAAPFDVLADMSPVVAQESWPRGRPAPVGCYYLCGVAGGTVAVDALSKAEAYAAAVRGLAKQLHDHGASLWQGPAFDWSVLHDPAGQAGPARLHAQFLRVNVEPSDLCDGGNRGAARHRLEAQDSGLRNLALAGTYLRTGINSTCVEAAVMAGMGAARAIHGELRAVIAEDFLARPFERGALPADRFDDDDAAPLEVAS